MKSKSVVAACAVGLASVACAAEYFWTGAEDAYWTNAANWTVGGGTATTPPGVNKAPDGSGTNVGATGDRAVFAACASDRTTINLDGTVSIKFVMVTNGAPSYVLGTARNDSSQHLRLESGAYVTLADGALGDLTVYSLGSVSAGTLTLVNNSEKTLYFYDFYKDAGNNPTLTVKGSGTFWQKGNVLFDQASSLQLYHTGDYIMEANSTSGGNRFSYVASQPNSGAAGQTRKLEIPAGCYLNTRGGGPTSRVACFYENAHIYGDGKVVLSTHWNQVSKGYSGEFGGNFEVSAGKTATIDSQFVRSAADGSYTGSIGLYGAGTLILNNPTNNCVGDSMLFSEGATLKVVKIGNKNCAAGESSLGLGTTSSRVRYHQNATLSYVGKTAEETDRTIASTNASSVVTMTVANEGGGTLTLNTPVRQLAAGSVGACLNLAAVNQPIVFNGDFEEGKTWSVKVSGTECVGFRTDPGESIPVTIAEGGKLFVSESCGLPSNFVLAGNGGIVVDKDFAFTLDALPEIPFGSTLDFTIPEGSSVRLSGIEEETMLNGVTVNGVTAKTTANGTLVESTEAVWTKVTKGTWSWSDSGNWLNGLLPGTGDKVKIDNVDDSSPTYTISLNQAATLRSIVHQETKGGSQTISGDNVLTLGDGGYAMLPNVSAGNWGWGDKPAGSTAGGQMNFKVPLHLAASQRWLIGAARGWAYTGTFREFSRDISSEEDVEWSILGFGRYRFTAGSSENFRGTAKVGCFIQFSGTNQFHRLGKRGITLYSKPTLDDAAVAASTTNMAPGLTYVFRNAEREGKVETPITLDVNQKPAPHQVSWCWNHVPIAMQLASSAAEGEPHVLELAGGISGTISSMSLLFSQAYDDNCPSTSSFNLYPDDQKIVISGDGSGFTSGGVTTSTMIEIAHPNALGAGNARGVTFGYDGYWGLNLVNCIHGIGLRPGLTYGGNLGGASHGDQNGYWRRTAFMFCTSAATPATAGATVATYNGTVSSPSIHYDRLRLGAAAGTTAKFAGKITSVTFLTGINDDPVDIVGPGDVELANGSNSFSTNLCVRSGRLVLSAATAAGAHPIYLGGYAPVIPALRDVRCVSASLDVAPTSVQHVTDEGGTVYYNKRMVWSAVPTIDGVTPAQGDIVLLNRPRMHPYNGLWKVVSADGLTWERPDEMDEAEDLVGYRGLRVRVTDGVRFGGKAFMLVTNPVYFRSTANCTNPEIDPATGKTKGEIYREENERFKDGCNAPVFHPEHSSDPDAAVVAGANGLVIATPIEVTDNSSAGASAIGTRDGVTAATFSGDIKLAKSVTLAAATDSTVTFTGSISGAGDIVGGGKGVSDVTGATVSIDGTNGFKCASGTLKVTVEQLTDRSLAWVRTKDATATTGDTIGQLSVVGDLDLSSRTVSFEGLALSRTDGDDKKHERKWPIATATGTLTAPTSVALPRGWTLSKEGNTLYLNFVPAGVLLIFR